MTQRNPKLSGGEFAAIEALAKLAREDTFRPGFPFGGTGEWTENLVELLGGPVGDFVGAVSPDVVDGLIAAVRERDNTIAKVRAIHYMIRVGSPKPVRLKECAHCETPWPCATIAALDPQETP